MPTNTPFIHSSIHRDNTKIHFDAQEEEEARDENVQIVVVTVFRCFDRWSTYRSTRGETSTFRIVRRTERRIV